jgi:8-oxo-dGTP diphosphatase
MTTLVVAAIITRSSRILICQRRRDKAFPLKWEFPGGKVEPGESLTDALAREISEELRVPIEIGREIYRRQYQYAELSAPIELVFYLARLSEQSTGAELSNEQISSELAVFNSNGAFNEVKWVRPAQLQAYEFLAANEDFISEISSGALPLE